MSTKVTAFLIALILGLIAVSVSIAGNESPQPTQMHMADKSRTFWHESGEAASYHALLVRTMMMRGVDAIEHRIEQTLAWAAFQAYLTDMAAQPERLCVFPFRPTQATEIGKVICLSSVNVVGILDQVFLPEE